MGGKSSAIMGYGLLTLMVAGGAVALRAFDLGPYPEEQIRLGLTGVGSGLLAGLAAGWLTGLAAPRGFRSGWFGTAAACGALLAGLLAYLFAGHPDGMACAGLALPFGAGSGGILYAVRAE